MIETEIKYFLGDEAAAKALVARAGLTWRPGEFEVNRIYDTPGGELKRQGAVVRLRTRGGKAWLTYKEKAGQSDRGAKVRIEHETEVSTPEAVVELLAALGLVDVMHYEKYRAGYDIEGAKLEVDRLPGGWFCEIEGEPDTIDRARERCGLDQRGLVDGTYPDLCRKLLDNNILQSLHWTFPGAGRKSFCLPPVDDRWWSRL